MTLKREWFSMILSIDIRQICLKVLRHSLFANHGQGLPRAKLEMYCLRQEQISSVALFYHFMQNITKHIRGRSHITSATGGGEGGKPNADNCWQGGVWV